MPNSERERARMFRVQSGVPVVGLPSMYRLDHVDELLERFATLERAEARRERTDELDRYCQHLNIDCSRWVCSCGLFTVLPRAKLAAPEKRKRSDNGFSGK